MPEDTSNDQPKKPRKAKTRRLIEGRPLCCGASMAKNGIENGKQCYVCTICGKTARDNPSKVGKPPLGEKAMTNAERQRRYKAKKKIKKRIDAITKRVDDCSIESSEDHSDEVQNCSQRINFGRPG